MTTSGWNYDVNFNGAIFVVRDSGSVLNILIFRNISCGNLKRKAVSMLVQTMENNEEMLQALHGKFGKENRRVRIKIYAEFSRCMILIFAVLLLQSSRT